ncbi:hypothetical protein Pmar_PMAR004294 [Perkinsus marinus ATCC 50983]|uniref:Uncharacterized protein n=1 Tax=Perkinsus marinus (strain ATCC 50983 / TXsc) TaxID=423536 RepID=C5K4D7_PERM5|nr:hypothetical protein Pmar_PMAR004294 [Perkinsus marinus ATCC 50983]EER20630.1 hypothetical protein Pmar_PMAR004294 [Perkinsus marinus ATCC 50983]|eukprot:XP_002788834.1 hypothetical protein Pmar_PMAR004294 [Perkinsus marinus ATCC 50983]
MWQERTEVKLRMEESRRLRAVVVEELRRRPDEANRSEIEVERFDPDAATSLLDATTEENESAEEETADDYVAYRTRGGVLVELDPDINRFGDPESKSILEDFVERKQREAEQWKRSPIQARPSSAVSIAMPLY